ncbi:MAG: PDZ domain-containing protein [Clostridia bacterium]|nr:PDZ domain-containing protein [Clostridia bacterium]
MRNKTIKLLTAVFAVAVAALIGVMSAYVIATENYRTRLASKVGSPESGTIGEAELGKLETIVKLIKTYSYYEIDEEDLYKSLIEGFVWVKADKYAYYYTDEEYQQMTAENQGDMEGIGVTVTYDETSGLIKIVSIFTDSPAKEAGLAVGDLIAEVMTEDGMKKVDEIGYELALTALRGKAGTKAEFGVKRSGVEDIIRFDIERRHVSTRSVEWRVYDGNIGGEKVGVVRITGFDLTTPPQFREAMDDLISKNCTYFVFDVRNNPGGDLQSIKAVLSLMLQRGDVVIRVRDRAGNETSDKVDVMNFSGSNEAYSTCNIRSEDIGKYREAVFGKSVVLANENTASAGELFTSAMKDYGIAKVVGVQTYGKGSMQSILPLAYYGYEGALKLTTRMYFPPLSEGYNGIGIIPDLEVPLAEELKSRSYLEYTDAEDNQLGAAVGLLGGAE